MRRWRGGPGGSAVVDDASWRTTCASVRLLRARTETELRGLRRTTCEFLRAKDIRGVSELELTAQMRCSLAAQACLPVLKLGLSWYRGWTSVIVYPGEFVATQEYVDEAGVVHHVSRVLDGESWEQGPVVLSWEGVRESSASQSWGNVVIHEMAHKLDEVNGSLNGMPPLHADMSRSTWTDVMTRAFEDLEARLEGGGDPGLDEYACESPAEFFAVSSEAFFAHPHELSVNYPPVYDQLRAFYKQDPLAG